MTSNIWTVLAIAPTADKAAIRKAYALRMRKIDPESDRDAFFALRNAYDAALVYAETDNFTGDDSTGIYDFELEQNEPASNNDTEQSRTIEADEPEMHIGEIPQQPIDGVAEARELQDFLWAGRFFEFDPIMTIDEIVAEDGVEIAWTEFLDWMAKGDISLREQDRAAEAILSHAVADQTLPRKTWDQMIKILGLSVNDWRFKGDSNLKDAVYKRLEAYRWYDNLKALAAQKMHRKQKHQIRAAWTFLKISPRFPIHAETLVTLRKMIAEYAGHETYLADEIDPAWIAALKARTDRAIKRANESALTILGLIAAFFIIDIGFILCRDAYEWLRGWLGH